MENLPRFNARPTSNPETTSAQQRSRLHSQICSRIGMQTHTGSHLDPTPVLTLTPKLYFLTSGSTHAYPTNACHRLFCSFISLTHGKHRHRINNRTASASPKTKKEKTKKPALIFVSKIFLPTVSIAKAVFLLQHGHTHTHTHTHKHTRTHGRNLSPYPPTPGLPVEKKNKRSTQLRSLFCILRIEQTYVLFTVLIVHNALQNVARTITTEHATQRPGMF